jgi:1-aminocyclopropane-1-carboxylate deaminase
MLFNSIYNGSDILPQLLFTKKGVSVSVLRLDTLHPIISGNKLFKLHYYLQEAIANKKDIITFGGAYSNHLVATAFACKEAGINCTGIVRGEQPSVLSHTLQQCITYGMQLQFLPRNEYALVSDDDSAIIINNKFNNAIIIPEGGYGANGAKGASHIIALPDSFNYTHICTAVGTATTLAGLLQSNKNAIIIGVPALRGMTDIEERIIACNGELPPKERWHIFNGHDFGGYAKKTRELIHFMNDFWRQYNVPTDFVYTAKMFYAVMNNIEHNYFAHGSNILCIHTGGLQGNLSLPPGTLRY